MTLRGTHLTIKEEPAEERLVECIYVRTPSHGCIGVALHMYMYPSNDLLPGIAVALATGFAIDGVRTHEFGNVYFHNIICNISKSSLRTLIQFLDEKDMLIYWMRIRSVS